MQRNLKKAKHVKILEWAYILSTIHALLLLVISLLLSTSIANAAANEELNEMEKNYLMLTAHSNYPIAKSLSFLRSGGYSNGLQYLHTLDRNWVMSVGGQFKNFKDKQDDRLRTMATGYHETLHMIRIYYPAYFLFGAQMLYLLPSLTNSIPPKRDPLLDTEVGVGLCAYVFTRIGQNFAAYFKVSRWRGTKTTRLQAYEVSFGLGRSI